MMILKAIFFIIVLVSISCSKTNTENQPSTNEDLIMWYNKPATDWMTEALPLGNGYIGSMFFGGVPTEEIQFTEGSLWTGGPDSHPKYNFGNNNPDAHEFLPVLRELMAEDRFDEANELAQKELTSKIQYARPTQYYGEFGAQQNLGSFFITVTTDKAYSISDYKRGIDLNTGHGFVQYTSDGIDYKRTYFGNYPDKVMVYRFESSEPSSYTISLSTPHYTSGFAMYGNIISKTGYLEDNNMRFHVNSRIDSDGSVHCSGDTIYVNNANYFVLYNAAATSYKNEFPHYAGNNPMQICNTIFDNIASSTYNDILNNQLSDYQELFNRVELELGKGNNEKPIDERLVDYSNYTQDLGLEEIYFQYGRYLMISGSRKGGMPLNLQGKWNNSTTPPWSCDYHSNINLQMLYWPAEITNLGECAIPLLEYIPTLMVPGSITARQFFNARGWTVNTINNPFGFTAVGEDMPWAFFPAGGAWLTRHLWEHYLYTQDTEFLRFKAMPAMEEAARFWVDYLTVDDNGYYVSNPSYSPEHGGISEGATMDHQIVRDLFDNYVKASEILSRESRFTDTVSRMLARIYPNKIGSWGQLQEWKEDVDEQGNRHRHVSHLFALYPDDFISPKMTPDLAQAAKVTLESRGDDGTGWSLAWKINFWARLEDGNHAHKLLRRLLYPVKNDGYDYFAGGTYSNLLCAHPPFQLDGNMGATAGIAEMLLNPVTETPLPALPDAWKDGHIKGLRTQKGNTINIYWENGIIKKVEKYNNN